MNKRYNNFGTHLRTKFGKRIFKISIDAGLSCPNRDGTKGNGGCIFCDSASFIPAEVDNKLSITDQLAKNTSIMEKRYDAQEFIAYFQNNTNTYGDDNKLISLYNEAISFNRVMGLSIGTRPDCVSDKILDYLDDIGKTKYVWIEYGLQSIHNETLKTINRGHDFECFIKTFENTRKRKNINVCIHVIHGLPGEDFNMMLETIKKLADLKIDGIKLHQLHVVNNTLLEEQYNKGEIKLLNLDQYLEIMAASLEHLPVDVLIHRLFGIGSQNSLIAPKWGLNKQKLNNLIDKYLTEKNTYQGRLYKK